MARHTEEPGSEPAQEREASVLARLLATPPNPKAKPKSGASPKKRGRPPKKND